MYLDKELFTYEDKKYDEQFSALYRNGSSQATKKVLTNTKVQLDGPKGKVNNYAQLKRFVRFDRFVFKNIIRKITSN